MKISLKHQATTKANSASCSVTAHMLNDENLNIAIATISGRYPDVGQAINLECDELAYVSEGEGKIVVNQKEYKLSAGDVVIIEAGEKFFWEGNMKLFISCNPAWNEDQHKMVE